MILEWGFMGRDREIPITTHSYPVTINVIPSLPRDLLVRRTVDNEHIARRFFDSTTFRSE